MQPLMEEQPTDLSDAQMFQFGFCCCGQITDRCSSKRLSPIGLVISTTATAAALRRLEGVKCNIWAISELYLFHFVSQSPALFHYSCLSVGCFLLFPRHTTKGLTSIISHLCCSIFIFAAFKHSTQPPPSLLPNAGIRE